MKNKGPIPSSWCISQVSPVVVAPPPSHASIFKPSWFGQRHLHCGPVNLSSVHEAQRRDGVVATAVVDKGVVGEFFDSLHGTRFEAGELLTKSFLGGADRQVTHLEHSVRILLILHPDDFQATAARQCHRAVSITIAPSFMFVFMLSGFQYTCMCMTRVYKNFLILHSPLWLYSNYDSLSNLNLFSELKGQGLKAAF